ncbi:expansin family protein, partial [Suillus cothurnatus]
MISTFATVVLSLIATSTVSALVVPRATAPSGWDTAALEPYDTYHCRYTALSCQTQHNTAFFSECCHPLAANESVSALPSECQMPSGSTCSNGELVSTGGSDDGCGDGPSSTPTASAPASFTSSSSAPASFTSSSSAPLNVAPTPTPTQRACGTVHSDNDFICAIDQSRYGNSGDTSSLCGQQVQITNQINGNTVVVTIADDCPTCANENSIDLSVAAFQALDSLSVGDIPSMSCL